MSRWILMPVLFTTACLAWLPVQGQQRIIDVGPAAIAGPGVILAPDTVEMTADYADPLPIRRIFVPNERLEATIAQAGPGGLVRMPRSRFEEQVRAASVAQAAMNDPPQLAEAVYRATWSPKGLNGTGEWKLTYPSKQGGLVGLEGLRMAVWQPTWSNRRPAILFRGAGDKSPPKLLADSPKEAALTFQWSCRGTEEPTAEKFDIGLPSSPISSILLDLPTDREPSVTQSGILLSGPLSIGSDRKQWCLTFSGQSRIELTIRRPGNEAEPSPQIRSSRSTRHELTPSEALSKFDFDIEAIRGTLGDLVFESDSHLHINQVTADSPLSWRTEPTGVKGVSKLRVTLRERTTTVRVSITANSTVPMLQLQSWTCPRIRVLNSLPAGDSIEVRTDSELTYKGCDPGDYRLADSGNDGDGYRVGFVGSLLNESTIDRRQPIIRLMGSIPEFTTYEQIGWTIGKTANQLTARVRVKVLRGPLARFEFSPPSGFTPEVATLLPDDPGASLAQGPNGIWSLEPSRPVPTGTHLDARIDMQGPGTSGSGDPASDFHQTRTVPFPRFTPIGAVERDGIFKVEVDPQFAANVHSASDKLSGIPFRGREPDGFVSLNVRPFVVKLSSDTVISLDQSRLNATTTLRLHPESSAFGSATIWAPIVPDSTWEWSGSPGVHIEPLHATVAIPWASLFCATTVWEALATAPVAMTTPVAGWRLRFSQPPSGDTTITCVWKQTRSEASSGIVPVPIVLGTQLVKDRVLLDPVATSRFNTPSSNGDAISRFSPLRLSPRGAMPASTTDTAKSWRVDGAQLHSRIEAAGSLHCYFSGRIVESNGPLMKFSLPTHAQLVEVRVAGSSSAPTHDQPVLGRSAFSVRLPEQFPRRVAFAITYRLPRPSGFGIFCYQAPVPEFPASQPVIASEWSSDSNYSILSTGASTGDQSSIATVATSQSFALASGILTAIIAAVAFATSYRANRLLIVMLIFLIGVIGYGIWTWPFIWTRLGYLPLIAGLIFLGAYAYPRRPTRSEAVSTASFNRLPWPNSTECSITLCFILLGSADAQSPSSHPVLITPSATRVNQFDALIQPALLKCIGDISRPVPDELIITAAEYDGVAQSTATFEAKFSVWSPTASEGTLLLPLSGVRLKTATLDGRPAFPEADAKNRYTLTVPGAGFHTVRMTFDVPVMTSGSDCDVQFGVPDVPCTRVNFTSANGSGFLDVNSRRGLQRPSAITGRPHVDADHGGGRAVVIRWRIETSDAASAVLAVREATIWDIREAGSTATSAFLFRSEGGSISKLQLDIPEDLEPAKLVVRAADGRSGIVGLKNWQLGNSIGGWQVLELGLQGPVDGSIVVSVRLHPKRSLTRRPLLRCPRAKGVTDASAYCAVRFSGVTSEEIGRTGLDDYPIEGFIKEFALAPELALDRFPPARAFRNKPDSRPELRPSLRPSGVALALATRSTWTVGSRADVETEFSVAARDLPVSCIEWELQGSIQVTEVRSPALAGWSQAGNRVQAWLNKPTSKAFDVRWSGILSGYQRSGRPGSEPGFVELPLSKPIGADSSVTDLWVRPADGWGLALQPSSAVKSSGMNRYSSDATIVPTVKFLATPPNPPVSIDSIVDLSRSLTGHAYRSSFSIPIRPNRAGSFTFRVSRATGAKLDLRGPRGTTIGSPVVGSDSTTWHVTFPAQDASSIELMLTLTLPSSSEVVLPDAVFWFGSSPVTPSVQALILDPTMSLITNRAGWSLFSDRSRATLMSRWSLPHERIRQATVLEISNSSSPIRIRTSSSSPQSGSDASQLVPSQSKPSEEASATTSRLGLSWLPGLVWLVGLILVGWLAGWGHPDWWPERLAGVGLLGLAIIGLGSTTGFVFAAMVIVGWAFRCSWSIRRLARAVSR